MPDYDHAAQRHWDDATLLLAAQRLPNADQLFGLSAECALKAIMLPLGMKMKGDKPEDKKHGHIDCLWDEFISFVNSRNGAKYAASLHSRNPFSGWRVHQRYEHSSHILPQAVSDHKDGAEQAFNSLTQAHIDGII
jgi:hypothetical protein